jgi:rubrerythrin
MQTGGKKMAEQMTLEQVLKGAVRKEIEAQSMYTGLSQKVKDEAVKRALTKLSLEEKGHQNRLEGYLERGLGDGSMSVKQVVDYKIAELAGPTEPSAEMGLKETFLVAANREKAAHALYTGLAGIHPDGEAKSLLLQLAAQELEHKQRVESLYTQVAYPQTDGG